MRKTTKTFLQTKLHHRRCIAMTILLGFLTLVTFNSDTYIARYINTPWVSGPDMRVKGRCVIIPRGVDGTGQWGNGVYYYLLALMYLVENGASSIRMPSYAPVGLIGLEGTVFRPLNNDANKTKEDEERCVKWGIGGTNMRTDGTMQDLIDFRAKWPSIMGNAQPNPFRHDLGVIPSMEEAAKGMDIPWDEVIVLHIRQGDAMAQARAGNLCHMQPPCSYYEDVVETGFDGKPFPYVLVITNKYKKNSVSVNPCAGYIKERYGSGRYPTKLVNYEEMSNQLSTTSDSHTKQMYGNHLEGLQKDLFILTEAINLGEGHSTFTVGAILLNNKLKRHFVVASSATINSVLPMKKTLDGRWMYTRQFFSENVTQTQYLTPGWLGHDASCSTEEPKRKIGEWHIHLNGQQELWKTTGVLTDKMLGYPRSDLVKFVTKNEPFHCNGVELFEGQNDKWYAPCICDKAIE